MPLVAAHTTRVNNCKQKNPLPVFVGRVLQWITCSPVNVEVSLTMK